MEFLTYSIPFIVAIVLWLLFKELIAWWEYIVLIGSSLLFSFAIECAMKSAPTRDTEYLGYYIVKISHYDKWNEYIHRTCTERVCVGHDSDGNPEYEEREYDCSYVEDHPDYWTYTLNDGQELYFKNKQEFDEVLKILQAPPVFVDMHRHYHTIDGDKQDYFYDGSYEHIKTITHEHSYINPIRGSKSVFNFETLNENDIKAFGLYDYPKIYKYDQKPVIGAAVKGEKRLRYINAIYGKKYQFRCFVLIFKDKPLLTAEKQKIYWFNGNKNEFVVCLGYNSKLHTVDWCECFSWQDSPSLEAKTKDYFLTKNKIDIDDYCKFLEPLIKSDWKRKEFSTFKYIEPELTSGQSICMFIITLIYNLIIGGLFVTNEYTWLRPS